jgi:isoleucyl-tRNA synthetase
MFVIADGLTRLLAPILSFTADELWRYLPARSSESVHVATFPERSAIAALVDRPLLERWARLTAVREKVVAEIEPLRKDKKIGSSLQARVVIAAPAAELAWLRSSAPLLPMLFIVSEVELRESAGDLAVTIERASGTKCERCWRYVAEVSRDPQWQGICSRCEGALSGAVHV